MRRSLSCVRSPRSPPPLDPAGRGDDLEAKETACERASCPRSGPPEPPCHKNASCGSDQPVSAVTPSRLHGKWLLLGRSPRANRADPAAHRAPNAHREGRVTACDARAGPNLTLCPCVTRRAHRARCAQGPQRLSPDSRHASASSSNVTRSLPGFSNQYSSAEIMTPRTAPAMA